MADKEFDALLREVLENPETLNDKAKISDEQVLELQKMFNPYSYVAESNAPGGGLKKTVAASYTNLREDYIRRFTMTSLVGFLFRMLDEWDAPAEARRWKPAKAGKKAAAWDTADVLENVEAIQEVAKIAKEAAEAAKKSADRVLELEKEVAAAEAAGDDSAAIREEYSQMLITADKEQAKAHGLQYVSMIEIRKLGQKSDERIEAFAEVARAHPDVREVIDKFPAHKKSNERELPVAAARGLVANFLRTWFEYNPDAHVRSAYDEFITPSKSLVEGLGPVLTDAADPARLPLDVVREAPPAFASEEDRAAFKDLTVSQRAYDAAAFLLRNETAAAAFRRATADAAAAERFRRYLFPVAADSPARAAVDVVPPQDTFHRWQYYTEVNFEDLRSATDAIYNEKPDLDLALIVYEAFEGSSAEVDEALADFRDKHQDEVISDIKGIDMGGWTLLGDFKENREKINFYNKHTDVLKRILDRHAEDKKLGQDLMRNRVRKLKAKNIREDGPDAPGLADYQTEGGAKGLGGMGAEKVISREEMYRLERAKGDLKAAQELQVLDESRQTIKELSAAMKVRELAPEEETRLKNAQADLALAEEMIEVPDDAIQVDVWAHDTASGSFGKSKFYTKAEAPIHTRDRLAEEKGAPFPSNTTAADLAPFAQEALAKEVAKNKLDQAAA